MATMTVKNAAGADEVVEKPLAPGRAAAAASRPVTLSTEDYAAIDGIEAAIGAGNTLLTAIDGHIDGVEALLTAIDGRVDGLETLIAATNTKLDAVNASGTPAETVAASQATQVLGAARSLSCPCCAHRSLNTSCCARLAAAVRYTRAASRQRSTRLRNTAHGSKRCWYT